MTDTCQISLIYRGVLGHRGVRIAGDSYSKSWTLCLANDIWTLTDHKGNDVHSFTQKDLHSKVAFPGFSRGYPDLYLFGLGPQVHCFRPDQEVLVALTPYVESSERANAPELARWHWVVSLGFLAFGVLCLAAGVAVPSWALWSDEGSRFFMLTAVMPLTAGVVGGGYFVAIGVRYLRKSNQFAMMSAARVRPGA